MLDNALNKSNVPLYLQQMQGHVEAKGTLIRSGIVFKLANTGGDEEK
jgi:hypothetical protein